MKRPAPKRLTEQQFNLLQVIASFTDGRIVGGYIVPVAKRLRDRKLVYTPRGLRHTFVATAAGRAALKAGR